MSVSLLITATHSSLVCSYGAQYLRIVREAGRREDERNMLRNHGGNFECLMVFNSAKMPCEKIREAGCTSAGRASVPQICRDVNSEKKKKNRFALHCPSRFFSLSSMNS